MKGLNIRCSLVNNFWPNQIIIIVKWWSNDLIDKAEIALSKVSKGKSVLFTTTITIMCVLELDVPQHNVYIIGLGHQLWQWAFENNQRKIMNVISNYTIDKGGLLQWFVTDGLPSAAIHPPQHVHLPACLRWRRPRRPSTDYKLQVHTVWTQYSTHRHTTTEDGRRACKFIKCELMNAPYDMNVNEWVFEAEFLLHSDFQVRPFMQLKEHGLQNSTY